MNNSITNQIQYEVKWEGYPEAANTWEPPSHLEDPHSLKLIRRFERPERRSAENKETDNGKPHLAAKKNVFLT